MVSRWGLVAVLPCLVGFIIAPVEMREQLIDLLETEKSLVTSLRENASRLSPLESAFGQLTDKRKSLEEIEKKLKIAEEGNLREVVGTQSKLASEKMIRETIEALSTEYTTGFTLSSIQRDFEKIMETAGVCTEDETSKQTMEAIKETLLNNNAEIKAKELELNTLLKSCAAELTTFAETLKGTHLRMSGEVAIKLADLKARGLATDIPGLELLLRQKTAIAKEIAAVEQRSDERTQCQEQRGKLREELNAVREEMTVRRKTQLSGINKNLSVTIDQVPHIQPSR